MGKHLLLISDNQHRLIFFDDVLHRAGIACNCTWAAGITILVQPTLPLPDIIFLDLNMQRLNGFDCLKHVKSCPVLSSVPVIIYSTGMNRQLRKKCLALGAAACIAKSDSVFRLAEVIQHFLQADAPAAAKISA